MRSRVRPTHQLEKDPDVAARVRELFQRNGWRAEGSLSEVATLAKYVDVIDDARGRATPFEKGLSRPEAERRLADRIGLSRGEASDLVGQFEGAAVLDGLASRFERSGEPEPKSEPVSIRDAIESAFPQENP